MGVPHTATTLSDLFHADVRLSTLQHSRTSFPVNLRGIVLLCIVGQQQEYETSTQTD